MKVLRYLTSIIVENLLSGLWTKKMEEYTPVPSFDGGVCSITRGNRNSPITTKRAFLIEYEGTEVIENLSLVQVMTSMK